MNETMLIELKNQHAAKLLEELEQMCIINIISREENKDLESNTNNDEQNSEPDTAEWHKLSSTNLIKAYSDNEPEYDLSMVKESNPDYEK